MRRLSFIVASLATILAAKALAAEVGAHDLVARAARACDLRATEVGPYRLRARVVLHGLVSGSREGQYVLLVQAPERWFEQTRFPGYTELAGRLAGESWRKRNTIDKPFRMHQTSRLLDPTSHLRLATGAAARKTWQEKDAGRDLACARFSPTSDHWQRDMSGRAAMSPLDHTSESQVDLCFDATSGALVSADYGLPMPRYVYEGALDLGGREFPRVMRCFEGNELAVEATVEELTRDDLKADGEFAPPAGAERWAFCSDPSVPRLVVKKSAQHLSYAKARRQFGTVVCLAEVGRDGILHDLTLVSRKHWALNMSVQEAVKGWQYEPAKCGDSAVPFDFYLAYTFPP